MFERRDLNVPSASRRRTATVSLSPISPCENEFFKVKGIISETVGALKASPYKDMRVIALQYQLFKDTIYDNLRALLMWLNAEPGGYSETRQKGTHSLKTTVHRREPLCSRFEGSPAESDSQVSTCSQPELRPGMASQLAHAMESPTLGKLIDRV